MNSVQLAQRLLRYLNTNDLANVPGDMALGICDAINGAIQEYYVKVPTTYKGTTFSGEFLPAQNITATFTKGSQFFTGWTADMPTQKGFSITVNTDQGRNILVGPNQMLDIFNGNSGSQPAQVYGDVLHLENIIERFSSDPVLTDFNRVLVRDENWRRRGIKSPWASSVSLYPFGSYSFPQVRTPWKYWIEKQGQSQGAYPPFMLRTDSLPDQLYRVRVEGLLAPTQVSIQDLTVPVDLSLDWYTIESTVLHLAARRLITHPLWRDPKIVPMVMADYKTAVDMCESRTPDQGASINYAGTPRGY